MIELHSYTPHRMQLKLREINALMRRLAEEESVEINRGEQLKLVHRPVNTTTNIAKQYHRQHQKE